ncbi:MarR family transcriptional regulator [Microbacterium sp. STN6]|uniref:MarR family winged helix-turn-helix transcriptional regulator n=1 Tax=Microbacterium sp. STN6 TaxID=2995588 RepID=UPI0022609C68|nr:MarR family transcriptional regulator [Microbacterium sp. STN6]MCX7522470.1 MarR family transcriptional regulator [Microbacterium sp. STN6]
MTDERHPPAEATELEEAFPVSYSIFAMARTHRALAGAELAQLGLFPNQEIMLIQLAASDGLSQKTLAETLNVNHATVAKTVGRMEKVGLVERRVSERDRRISLVYLTPAGRALHERVIAIWRHLEELTAGDLTEAERNAFLRAAGKIRLTMSRGAAERAADSTSVVA